MGKTNSTFVRPFWMASLFALAMFLTPALLNAQCQDNVVVTLDASCEFTLTPDQVSAGPAPAGSSVFVDGMAGATISGTGTFNYGLVDAGGNLICWGTVTAEDKTAPVVTAPAPLELECWLVDDVLNQASTVDGGLMPDLTDGETGEAEATDGCEGDLAVKWSDSIEYFDCDENGDTTAILTRRFTATDSHGNSSSASQTIAFVQVGPAEFAYAAGQLEMENGKWVKKISTCNPEDPADYAFEYPVYTDAFGETISLNDEEICNLSLNESGTTFGNICGDGFKEERTIKIFDWCLGMESPDTSFSYILKVSDFDAPEFNTADDCIVQVDSITATQEYLDSLNSDAIVYPADCGNVISTGPMNCTAAFSTDLSVFGGLSSIVTDDCGLRDGVSITVLSEVDSTIGKIVIGGKHWVEGDYPRMNGMIMGLPVGNHALVISVDDECYNTASGLVFFSVEDRVKPVMKCDDDLRVTLVEGDAKLGIGGYALARTADVDEGSWDNCELVSLEVRRDITGGARADWEAKNGDLGTADYTPWADIVEFFCADLDGPVEVQLRGTDSSNNTSICWLNVEVENGTNVGLVLEGSDQTITCEEYKAIGFDAIATAGAAIAADGGLGCSTPSAELSVVEDIDQCGFGTITISIDASSVSADDSKNVRFIDDREITISVVPVHDYWIQFPADDEYFCTEETAAGVTLKDDVACDLLTVYQDDEIFRSVADPDACYKIFRTYKVINWCEYDGESLPTIVSRDWDAINGTDCVDGLENTNPTEPDGDGAPGDEDIFVIVDIDDAAGDAVVYYDNDSDPTNESADGDPYWFAITEDAVCTPSTWNDAGGTNEGTDSQDDEDNRYGSFGYWQYTQHIIVYDNTVPVVTVDVDAASLQSIDNENCDANVNFTINVSDDCSTDGVSATAVVGGTSITLTGNADNTVFTGTIADAPLGKHTITVTVDDGCGNVFADEYEIEVVDAKGPAPICHDGIVVELMPTEDGAGMAEVWATDLIASPIEDCTALSNDASGRGVIADEAYSIFLNDGFTSYDDAVASSSDPAGLFFSCADAGTEPMVRVYAEDEAGNVDYCLTFVRVQDNNSVCAPAAGGSIAGAVATETAANVEGVEVQLSGSRSMMYMTDANGTFDFSGLAQGGDYTVTPQKDLNHLNGVSTFDLVLISKHILGVSQLDSPYKMIAADVNNSQSITTLDLIQLRKLILNIDTEFANNTSWRFIDKSHVFPNPSNPWATAIPEFKNINNLGANAEAEFVATKIGDVNGSATVEARSATGEFAINTAEQAMIAGNEYTIDFSADMTDVAGYQFTLDVANAEIVDIIYGAAKAENFGVFTKEGVITTSFNGDAAGTLFSLVVRATADVKVSEAIQISSRYTAAEAYTNDAEQLNVNLNVAGATATEAAFALNQNTPNPFQGETQIGFNLPEAQEATITLQDVAGRTVKMIEGDFAKGYNQVTISANELPSAGVYFYTLTAGDKSATKKLILVDALNR